MHKFTHGVALFSASWRQVQSHVQQNGIVMVGVIVIIHLKLANYKGTLEGSLTL